jgi:hypothetical protein
MEPPFFLYDYLPEPWADWCCEHPNNLAMVFASLAVLVAGIAHGRYFGWL